MQREVLFPFNNGIFVDPVDPAKLIITIPTPENLKETWTLDVIVGDVRAQRMPFKNFVSSVSFSNAESKPEFSLLLLSCINLVLIFASIGFLSGKQRKLKRLERL